MTLVTTTNRIAYSGNGVMIAFFFLYYFLVNGDPCWEKSGYRQEGREGFSELDAGETYEEEPDIGGLFE
jgi:hypothetical protein